MSDDLFQGGLDEIQNPDKENIADMIKRLLDEGKVKACVNKSHLSEEEKSSLAKQALNEAMEKLMKEYLSLGIHGHAVLIAEEGLTKRKFKLEFKALLPGEEDGDFS